MKKTLGLIFLLMVVFGGFYLARGWPKGTATILFESCSILTGLAGLIFLGILGILGLIGKK